MPPDLPSVLVPAALDPILAGPALNCFRRAWYNAHLNFRGKILEKKVHIIHVHG